MICNIFQLRSLKTRVTLFSLAIFLVSIWSLAFYASRILRENMQRFSGDQQFSTVSFVAEQVNDQLTDRLQALESIAGHISPAILADTDDLQALLEQRPILLILFNAGIWVTGVDGTAIASLPLSLGRIGINYMDRDHIIGALKEGKTMIGRPVIGKTIGVPIVTIGVPIRDTRGNVIGSLNGVTDLGKPNFLDKISGNRYGKTGGYLLIAPQHKLIVTGTDKSRIMQPIPAPGINPLFDRYLQGFEGSGVVVDSRGIEVLSSAKQIPVAGWFVVVRIPTAEAFAPINAMLQQMLLATILLTLTVGVLIWWMLRRQLLPLFATVKTLATFSDSSKPLSPLAITGPDELGELIGAFNRLLETLVKRQQALRESEETLRQVLAVMPIGLWILDKDGSIASGNDASKRIWAGAKYVGPEQYGEHKGWWLSTGKPIADEEWGAKRALQKGEISIDEEIEIQCFDGNHKIILHSAVPLFNAQHAITGAIVINQDITKRKQAEQEKAKLEAQNRQLQKVESLGVMAGAIAHHFNNQLGGVIGNLEMALADLPRDAAPVKHLTAAIQAAQKAAEVSGQMLTYLGQTPSMHTPLDLSEICRQSLSLLQATAPKSTPLKADLPFPGPRVSANTNQIQQVLTNLVTNAWEAVEENKGTLGLTVKLASPAELSAINRFPSDWQPQDLPYACLEVTDTGCGIAMEDIEKLFDPFFSSKFTGRGLGLSVVLGIVKAHDGAVTVESAVGCGSSFRVLLPVSVEELPRQPVKIGQSFAVEGHGTVLLVEDEEILREIAAIMIARLGYRVIEAKNGVEAVEMFRRHQAEIRCVLSDVMMPRMDGWEAMAALRKLAPDIPVILSSGYDEAQVMAGEHPERPQVFLHKPYQMADLQEALARALTGDRGKIGKCH